MQKTRLMKFAIIGLFILLVTSIIFVYAFSPSGYETFLCTKSVTLKGGEQNIVEFYMPPGPVDSVKFDFSVSSGTIKYWAEPSSHFDCDPSYFEQFIDEMTSENPRFLRDVGNETAGCGWTIVAENPEEIIAKEYADQIWYIYLFNEDSSDKEVQINISKIWEL